MFRWKVEDGSRRITRLHRRSMKLGCGLNREEALFEQVSEVQRVHETSIKTI